MSFDYALKMHGLTQKLPPSERYELGSQIRRAAFSVPLNIAEGFARNNNKELKHFLRIALGSCNEVLVILEAFLAIGYVTADVHKPLDLEGREITVKIANFIKSIEQNLIKKT